MTKKLITPLSSLADLVKAFDGVLVGLDSATDYFENSVLNVDALSGEEFDNYPIEQREEILLLLENYTLMSGFLLEHPLLSVIRQIREESKLNESNTNVMAIKHQLKVGQQFKHYKGVIYTIVSIAKNSNLPTITNIHYTSGDGNIWELPIHEFTKKITILGNTIDRFAYIK